MRARIPAMKKPTKKQVTGAQLEEIINSEVAKRLESYTQQSLVIYQLCSLIALKEYAGYGNKRLDDYMQQVAEVSAWYEKLLHSDGDDGVKLNLDIAVNLLVRRAEEYGIDWQNLLSAELVDKPVKEE